MKNERKPKPPVIAAHSEKKNGQNTPAPKGKNNGRKAANPRAPKTASLDVGTLPLQNPYPVMRLAQDGQPLFGNPAAEALLGFSIDQSIPEHWHEMVRSTLETGSSREMDLEHNGRIFSALFVPVQQGGYVNVYCSDRTTLYEAQRSLIRSEERFRQAADAAGALVYEVDLLTSATAIVHGMQRFVGYDPQSFTPTSDWWHSLIHPDDLDLHLKQLNELLARGGTDVCQYRLLHKNGNWIDVQDNRLVILNEMGQSVRLIGTVTDTTVRKQVEETLRAKETELQDLIDQTPFMLTRCTRDLRYRFVSRAYAEMVDRKPEDVAGSPILEIMGEDGFNSISPYVEKVLSGEHVEYETEVPFKDVGTRSLHVIYTPDRDDQGSVIGWFASITDVSMRKGAEQERNRALQREQWQREVAEQAWLVAEEARVRAEEELSERKLAEAALGSWADMPLSQERRPLWLRYGIALAATGLVILLRQLLDPLLGTSAQYSLLIGSIAFSVWYGGMGPAFLSLLLGYVGITWIVLDWGILLAPTPVTVVSLIIFLVSGALVILLGETMRRAQHHAHQSAGLAVKRQREIELRLVEQKRTEQELRDSEQRFRDIFESAGVSVWVEDFSQVKALIDDLRLQGVTDFQAYFTANPELVRQAIGMINVLDVNQGTLDLYHASSKEQLLGPLSAMFTPEAERAFVDELAALAEGREMYRSEKQTQTLDGQPISILFAIHFNPLSDDYRRVIVTVTDITERKRMEVELARERELFKRLFETMPVMSTIYDPETGSMLMNKHIQELTGWKQEDVTVESLLHALYPDPAYLQEVLGRMAAAAGTNEWVDARIQTRDGRTLDTLWANISLMDGDRIITGISLGIDITERKQMEEALRLENQRFMKFFDANIVGIVIGTAEGGLQLANDYYLNLLGVTRQEFNEGTVDWRCFTPEDWLHEDEAAIAQLNERGFSDPYEKEYIRRDGVRVPVYIANALVPGPGREIAAFVLDITERKRMADAIRESEERYRAIVSQTTAGIAESDMESRLIYVNPRFCEMLGYTESELLGKTIWELTYTDDLARNKILFKRMMEHGNAYQFEKRFIRRDGSHLWANVSVSPIGSLTGKPRGGVGVVIDIEERKRAEAALLEYARQQEALFKLAERLQHTYAPQEIYDAALDAIRDALHCDRASILLFDETSRMRFVAWRGLSDAYRKATDGHSPWTVDEVDPQPIFFNAVDQADISDELKAVIKGEGIGSLGFIPLVPNGNLIGKFMVYFNEPHEFNDAELNISQTIARQLAFDIARKRAEEQLHASREWLNQIIETVQAVISVFDVNGKLLMINSAGANNFGKPPEQLVGKTLYDLYPFEFADSRVQLYRGMIEAGEMRKYDIEVPAKDGTQWYQVAMTPMIDAGSGQPSMLSAAIDITERKRAEGEIIRLNAELQSQLDEMKALMEILPTGVWIGNADCSVITGNPAAYEIMGLNPGSNVSVTNPNPQTPAGLEIFVNSEEVQPDQAPMQQVAQTGKPLYNIEHELRFPNGTRKSVFASIVPLFDHNGAVRKVIGAYTDFSERKRLEEELRRSAEYDAFRLALADTLRRLSDPDAIISEALRILGEKLNMDRMIFSEIDSDDETIMVLGNYVKGAFPKITGHASLQDYGKTREILGYGQHLVINDTLTSTDLDNKDKAYFLALGIRSAVGIPLIKENRWAATLGVHHGGPHQWTQHEINLITETAERTWASLERARSQAALHTSEERMRLAIESHRMVAWEWDVAADAVTTSANLHEVYGLSEVNTAAEGFSLIWPEDLPAHQEQVNRVMQSGGEYHSEFRITRPVDGRVVWMEERATAITDGHGKVIRLVGIVIDVTERRQAEEALRLSEQRLRMATEAAGMFAWDAELSTGALHWSENAASVIGCQPQDLPATMDRSLFFVAAEDSERVLREYEDVLKDKSSTYTTEFRGQGDVHTSKHFLMHARILYNVQGAPVRVVGVTQDITQRKHGEQELKEAREHAEQTADRIARLQEITSALASSFTSEQLSELILEQGTRAAGATAGIMVEVVNEGRDVKAVAALGDPSGAVHTEPSSLADKTPVSDAIRTKQAIWIESHQEFAVQYPELAEMRRGFGYEAVVALPLVVEDRTVGCLAFSFTEKRSFLLEERGFLLALAQQCAQGLQRVRDAEALRASEQRFAGFMQHLPGMAWIKDIHGQYVFANDAVEKTFGVKQADLYHHTDADIFPRHMAEEFRRSDEQALLENKSIQLIEQRQHEDGFQHYLLVNKFPIVVSDGATILIGGMSIDITERKQAEERLALMARISELIRDIENAEDLMAVVSDAVGSHLQVKRCLFNEIDVENDVEVVHHDYHHGVDSVAGIHRLTEYSSITSAEMMEGVTVVNHDSKTDPRTAEDYERSYLPNGERSYVAVPLMRDGHWSASLWVSDDKPRVWTVEEVALLQTIAERTWTACEKLRIHGELRDSEERLRVTFNTTAVGFAMLGPDTHFVDVNQAFCEIVGYERKELLTMNFDFLIHPDYVKSTRDHIRRLLRGKIPAVVIEKLYIRKDGSDVWVQNSMSLVRDVDGNPLHLIVISQDITERKQIEALQKSATESLLVAAEANAKFRTFFDQGSYFAGVMALDGTLMESNRLSLEFCGYRRQDVIGKKFWDCGWWNPSPELMDMVRKGTQKALEGETFRQETTYYIADGSVRYVDLIIAPIKDENGRLLFLAPTGTDITERKRHEEELRHLNMLLEERVEKRTLQLETSDLLRRQEILERRQAQDRFAKSFTANPAAMSITRFDDGMYRNVNPKFIELLEYGLDEVIGRTSLDLNLYKNSEERVGVLKTIRDNNGSWTYETQLATKSGKVLDVSISVVEIELEGEPHILSMIMDITERNQILAALRASEQQLRTLFDVLPVGVAYVSPERKVIDPNRTLEKILGISREDMINGVHRSLQYIRPDGSPMPDSEFASLRALREQRTINNVETGIIKEGGQVIWTSVSATPISMPEPGVVVITVDVTERKHMDDELRRSHKRFQMLSRRLVEIQEEERRTISRELHDRVGQSLAALNLNLSFLNNSLSGTSSLQVKSRLKDAIQLTEETVSTIRDVMADLRPPALDDYGLEAALNAYADTFSRRFGIRVTLAKPAVALPRLHPSIELTLLRITQEALTNVAKHAKATQATVTLAMQNDMVYLNVEDNGEGIRSWQMANRPGSHGLKIMRERAETFGGTLQVQSFNKIGTRIEVKIPVRGNDQPAARAESD